MNDYQAIVWGTRVIYRQKLEQYIASVIKHLKGRGIRFKDRIAIIENNSIEYVIVLLSLWRMGVVVCPLNPRWPVETLLECSQALKPKVICTSQKQFTSSKKNLIPTIELNELISFDARQSEDMKGIPPVPLMDQEATIIWTSGSSAQPKAAVHTWANHFYSAAGSQEVLPLNVHDRWVLSLPLYHVSGISIVCRCFLAGATIVMGSDDEMMEILRRAKPTHLSLVPTQLYRLVENKDSHPLLKSLKYILLGGSAIPQPLLEKSLFLDLPVYISYGLTETSSQVATSKVEKADRPYAKVLPYRQVKVDEQGQILVKGEVLFKGYLQQNKITLPLTNDGWFETRDRGKLENDCLTVLGRLDNMFICAGENIQPEEIENVLLKISQVRQAIVIPKEDPEYGFRPIAFVRTQGHFNRQLFESHCASYLPKIKVPVAFYPWPEEVLNQGIKISRKFFQERLGNLLED
jgi:O-succinylbenzoic acid--CoA ligase